MRSIGHPVAAGFCRLIVTRTDNGVVESIVSMKVTESCRRHPTYLEGFFHAACDKGLNGDITHYSFVCCELKTMTATGEASPPLVRPC